jgi:hypothetical protein
MSTSPNLRERVLQSVSEVPARTQRETVRARAWLVGCGIVGALVIFFAKGGVRPTARPPLLIALTSAGTAVIVGLGMWLIFTRGRSMLGRPRVWVALAAVGCSLGFIAWRFGISAAYGLTAPWAGRVGFRCLSLSIATGALPLFAALITWRHTEPLTPKATGAAFGAGAGLASAVLVDLWCPVSYLPHLLLGHLLPIAILAGVGALVGGRLLRLWRR